MIIPSSRLLSIILIVMLWIASCGLGISQGAPPLLKAAANDELPLPAWGPYSSDHVGPCCLVNRLLLQQFAFPIVISQQRDETLVHAERGADGRVRARTTSAVLLRRSMGLSPVHAAEDDRVLPASSIPASSIPGKVVSSNRQVRPLDADRDGLLWRSHVTFAPAGLAQDVAAIADPSGLAASPAEWGAGEATVDYFPAFAEPAGDGLLVRVALANRSDRAQTYCVDLLGGLDIQTDSFSRKDLTFETAPQDATLVVKQAHCSAVFALAANNLPYTVRRYQVGDAYFSPAACVASRDPQGGIVSDSARSLVGDASAPPSSSEAPWGLLRLAGIAVEPGQTVVLFLSIGVGADADAAREGARTLLNVAEDTAPAGSGHKSAQGTAGNLKAPPGTPDADDAVRSGAYTRALSAHADARWPARDEAMAGLMAQTLFNAPLRTGRRRGIASRVSNQGREAGQYSPIDGGMIALALTAIQPSDAAAELNVHYWTQAPMPPGDAPRALAPINLFALWELYQRTHDTSLLTHFYPAAVRDYREMLAAGRLAAGRLDAGRTENEPWQFAWPPSPRESIFAPTATQPTAPAPGYAAYVIRTARLLREIAVLIGEPVDAIQGYANDIQQATVAMNADVPASQVPGHDTRSAEAVWSLLPLAAGAESLPVPRRAALLAALTDPSRFWSPTGVRQASRAFPGYVATDPTAGAVRFGMNWLLWKSLLDLDETAVARQLANNVLSGYESAHQASGGCPEWLDGGLGAAGGALDVSGDACGLVPIYAAYHLPGTVTTGWSLALLDQRYDAAADSLHVAFVNLEPAYMAALLCVLGKPHGVYALSGALRGTAIADGDGVLTLTAPKDPTTQALDIVASNITTSTITK